jgi:pyruvate/2-oxoglutarate dehydrogenase complex dihydrolipoamide dehydrogenase (E3) component
VPSKTLLRSGETLTEADRARLLAASRVEWTIDFPKVSTRVLWMARNLDDSRPAAAMEASGARLFRGEGKLADLRTVAVGSEQLVARRAVVIANGSTAAIKLGTPLNTLADVIHPFPAFNRMLGERLEELAAKVASKTRRPQ